MLQVLTLILIITFSKSPVVGQQNENPKIILRATTSVVNGEYFIYILPGSDSTKLKFKLKDHVNIIDLEADTNTIKYRKVLRAIVNAGPESDTFITYLQKLDSLFISYTQYNTDSITLPNDKNRNYLKLVQKVLNTPSELLENKTHHVLDGTWMNFSIDYNGIKRTVYAHSPTAVSNPLLYQLVTETTSLYRENKKNNFLTKAITCGY